VAFLFIFSSFLLIFLIRIIVFSDSERGSVSNYDIN
jgi:hypothetical protein